ECSSWCGWSSGVCSSDLEPKSSRRPLTSMEEMSPGIRGPIPPKPPEDSAAGGDRDLLDGVAAVAVGVPLGFVGLGAAGEVGRPGPDSDRPLLLDPGQQLPPPPAVGVALPDQPGGLPRPSGEANLDPRDRGRPSPGHAPND